MFKFASTLCLIAFASMMEAQNVEILYDVTISGEYRGRIVDQNIQADSSMVNIVGVHLPNRTNSDVLVLESSNSTIQVFPHALINAFSNLRRVRLQTANMTRFSNPIQSCESLDELLVGVNLLTSIPAGIFRNCRNLTQLSFLFNQLTALDNEAFAGLENLQTLELSLNRFVQVNPTAFAPLANLRYLNLAYNEITELSPTIFQFLPQLIDLNLVRNNITSWNQSILATNLQLTRVSLSDNLISTISDDMFPYTLQQLSVGNHIETIPRLTNHRLLRDLSFGGNKIKNVSIDVFDQLLALQVLDLGRNEITNFDFSNRSTPILQSLNTLLLTGNNITNIPDNAFSSLTSLLQLNLDRNNIERLNRNSIRPTITRLRILNLQTNRIARIERELFTNVSSLTLRMSGNVCYSADIDINQDFETSRARDLLRDCFNFATSSQVNILVLLTSLVASLLWKF